MKIYISLLILIACISNLSSSILEVCLTGDKQFTTIQSAIDYAVPGDSIIVYPGTYFGQLDLFGKMDLHFGSLFSTTADTTYVSKTILDGNKKVPIVTGLGLHNVTIEGFTIQNGRFHERTYSSAGGFLIFGSSNITLSYNIIKDNFGFWGGGVYLEADYVTLIGNQIYRNTALHSGGGVYIFVNTTAVVFCPENKNSIYNNLSMYYNDIFVNGRKIDIPLKKSTFSYSTMWNITQYCEYNDYNSTVTIEEAYITEIDSDLYVSPFGDDNNSGLTPNDALRTISRALFLVKSDSLSINTVYVADGLYNIESGERFPLRLKRFVKVIGESKTNTIIDIGNQNHGFASGYYDKGEEYMNPDNFDPLRKYKENITIENFHIKNTLAAQRYNYHPYATSIALNGYHNESIYTLKNIIYSNTRHDWGAGQGTIQIGFSDKLTISNLTMDRHNLVKLGLRGDALLILNSREALLENVLIDGGFKGITFNIRDPFGPEICNITLSNVIVRNLHAFGDANYGPRCALVIYNDKSPYGMKEKSDSIVRVINSTFQNNISTTVIADTIDLEFYNTIFSGRDNDHETARISLMDNFWRTTSPPIFENCVLHNVVISGQLSYYVQINNPIYENPLFIEQGVFPEHLSSISPAIASGTFDIPNYIFPEFDIAGNPRIRNEQIDIGALQYQELYAAFSADVTIGAAPLSVKFTDMSYTANEIISYAWDFNNDGVIDSTEKNPVYTFATPGNYSVKLTISNGLYSFSTLRDNYINTQMVNENEIIILPIKTQLTGNYPNPFNPETTISFALHKETFASIDIYNIKGQKIRGLMSEFLGSGNHQIVWNGTDDNGRNVSSGVYFYRLITDDFTQTKRMVMMK